MPDKFAKGKIGEKAVLTQLEKKSEEIKKASGSKKPEKMTEELMEEVEEMNDGTKKILKTMVNERIYKTTKSFFKRFRKSNLLDALVKNGVVTLNNEKTELVGDLNMEKFRGLNALDLNLGKSNMGKGVLKKISEGCVKVEKVADSIGSDKDILNYANAVDNGDWGEREKITQEFVKKLKATLDGTKLREKWGGV